MRKIVLFDVCFTLFDCNTTFEFFKFISKDYFFRFFLYKIFNRLCLIFKAYNFFDNNRMLYLKGIDEKYIKNELNIFYDNYLKYKKNSEIFEKISFYKANKYEIFLVSASMFPVIEVICNKLDIDGCYATDISNFDGKYDGKILNDLLKKGKKRDVLLKQIAINGVINYDSSIAYSDSKNDLYQWGSIKNKFLVTNGKIKKYDK